MPAGTHKHAIVYAIIRRMAVNMIAEYSNVLDECEVLIDKYNSIQSNIADYHVGSLYLTGRRGENFLDSDADKVLGRCSTFIMSFYPYSTISMSPHVSSLKGKSRHSKGPEYPDYSEDYKSLCNALVTSKEGVNLDSIVSSISSSFKVLNVSKIREKLNLRAIVKTLD